MQRNYSGGLFNIGRLGYAQILFGRYFFYAGSTMTEASPLVRQWILLRSLCARRYGTTVKELAGELGVGEKTIRRDIKAFQTAGFPIIETVGQFGRKSYRIDPEKSQPGMSFAFDEAVVLYLGRRFLEPLAGTVFWEAAQRAFRKIRATLGRDALKYVERFAPMFHQTTVGASDYSDKADLIDDLMVAIEDRRAVFLTYQSLRATEPVTYDIYPFGLTYHRDSLYLVGQKVERTASRMPSPTRTGRGEASESDDNAIRHWKVDRIEALALEEIHFNRPDDFDLRAHFAKSFGVFHGDGAVHATVRFSPTVARYVQESTWHESQKLTSEKDGSLLAEFDLDGTEEIARWLLSFGRHAEVLEPQELRESVCAELEALLSRYINECQSENAHERPNRI